MKKLAKRIFFLVLALGVVALLVVALRPFPLKVDLARAQKGSLRVTIDQEGETRVRDRFVVAAPVAGRLARIQLRDGDRVAQDDLIAVITPLPLDPRERAEITARVEAAEASEREATQRVEHARANHEQARRDRERAERLLKNDDISLQSFELARNAETVSASELAAARFKAQAAAFEVKVARAGLLALETQHNDAARVVRLLSPVRGRVFRVLEQSQRVVTAGTPLVVLGDASRLEVVIDVLSTDAVKVKPGAPVLLEDWGGNQPIRARVRLVEPYAFTKVSALGIEEQRVNVVADFLGSPGPLGDGYRVEARIVIWEAANVLKVPSSALFSHSQGWSVFVVEAGRAQRRPVSVGHRTPLEVEILEGLPEGAEVILHPTNQIESGARVEPR